MSLKWTENAACSGKQKHSYFDFYLVKDGQGICERIYSTVDLTERNLKQTELTSLRIASNASFCNEWQESSESLSVKHVLIS